MLLFFCVGTLLAAAFDPPQQGRNWSLWLIGGISGGGTVGLLVYLARHRIIADENGLRWRRAFSDWKSVRWDEVSDFSLAYPTRSSHLVETAQGTLTFSDNDAHVEELAQSIAAHATKVPYREWLWAHERENARFELVFATPLVSGRALLLAWAPIALAIMALLVALRPQDFALWRATRETAGWAGATWITLAPLALAALFFGLFPAIILGQIIGARWLNEIERVTATERGLRFEKSGQTRQIAWNELRAVHLFNRHVFNARARFETTRGDWEIGWRTPLRPLIERFAPAATVGDEAQTMELAAPISLADGAIFYPFRTVAPRVMRQLFGLMTVGSSALLVLTYLFTPPQDGPPDISMGWLTALFFALWFWLWRLHHRGGIALSADAIELRGAWRDRVFLYDEIEECGGEKGEFWIRVGERQVTLWNWNAPIRLDDVRAEIERRVKL